MPWMHWWVSREILYSVRDEMGSQWSDLRMGVICSCFRTLIRTLIRIIRISTVLDVLELFEALARDPDEKCVAVVQPGGDKGVDEVFLSQLG